MNSVKARLQRFEVPLTAAVLVRQAEWLESLAAEDLAAGVLGVAYRGDVEALKRAEPDFRAMSESEIAAELCRWAPAFIADLRQQARELRGRRR